jgi:hypothetical protein
MRRACLVICLAVLTLGLIQVPASAAPVFRRVVSKTSGPALLIRFKEAGLQPGQNYAYTGDAAVSETFQCYRDRTFTPTKRTVTIDDGVLPDPRSYVADADGVVRGFIYLWPDIAYPDLCHGRLSTVAVGVCYRPRDVVDFSIEGFDVYWFADGTEICGPIEPD